MRLLFYHELGHAADLRRDVPVRRKRRYRSVFERIMRYRTDVGRNGSWLYLRRQPGHERLAHAYAWCARNPYRLDPAAVAALPGYGYRPTQDQHKRVCRLLRRWL